MKQFLIDSIRIPLYVVSFIPVIGWGAMWLDQKVVDTLGE